MGETPSRSRTLLEIADGFSVTFQDENGGSIPSPGVALSSLIKKGRTMSATAYAKHFQTRVTPQTEPIPGKPMVANSAGGYTFAVDDWARLNRFLVLGSEGGSYYATERKLTIDNAQCVLRCLGVDPTRAVAAIVAISEAGRAPKNDAAIFALAVAAGHADPVARRLANEAIPKVCRIGTHLFQFVEAVEGFRGWGKGFAGCCRQLVRCQDPRRSGLSGGQVSAAQWPLASGRSAPGPSHDERAGPAGRLPLGCRRITAARSP
jgi:hypothetical protein